MNVRSTRPTGPPIIGCLVGNKADLRDGTLSRAEVSHDEASRLASDLGLNSFEVSASANTEVDTPFIHIAKEFYKRSVTIFDFFLFLAQLAGYSRVGFEGYDSNEPATLRAGLVSCNPRAATFLLDGLIPRSTRLHLAPTSPHQPTAFSHPSYLSLPHLTLSSSQVPGHSAEGRRALRPRSIVVVKRFKTTLWNSPPPPPPHLPRARQVKSGLHTTGI